MDNLNIFLDATRELALSRIDYYEGMDFNCCDFGLQVTRDLARDKKF